MASPDTSERPEAAAPPPAGAPLLAAAGLCYAYGGSSALRGVSLSVAEGEILTVTGPRGSGKTTLLRCLNGSLLPEKGEVTFAGLAVHTLPPRDRERLRRDRFGWVGTEPALVPELTAWENAALPLLLAGASSREARRTALEWLERLDVAACARKRPAALPQSERQRVAVARALVHRPQVLFADEPDAPLHSADRAQVLRALTTAARTHGVTVVLASLDAAVLRADATEDAAEDGAARPGHALADRTLTLLDGRPVPPGAASARSATPHREDGAACSLSV
ncbi:ATP-binding cassette domain-containing protein [Streptomyces sp. JJ66]|uniref:ABC transporter ATP-binding protein n=1 Tax=Streptomyces sp. JJ66 TaxID=2803843 RepID=UPI001C55CABF|nr:ATP-binding cassette domain-containing protein [Streptomyces sp. JJ66]MBW1601245.1 ATP-binding cassette domain-containing protein [Streptomyces sp. JJ66]